MSEVFDPEREDILNERRRLEEKSQVLVNERKAFEAEKQAVRQEKSQMEKQIKEAERAKVEKEKIQFLKEGMALPQKQYLQSQNGVYYALLQSDGNFVVYVSRHAVPANAIWSTNTRSREEDDENGPYCLLLREDGRLVLIDDTNTEIWTSGVTGGGSSKNYCLKLEDDGNLVLRDGSERIVWQSHSSRGDPSLLLPI